MSNASAVLERPPWPHSGTRRGRRASYVVTLLQTHKRSITEIIEDIGWPEDEAAIVFEDCLSLIRYALDEPEDSD